MFPNGMILNETYEIRERIGHGGSGAVYAAYDIKLRKLVAIKYLHLEGDHAIKVFGREASLLANLHHPSLPKIYLHFSTNAGQFLVMDLIDGDDLSTLLERQGGPLPVDQVLGWADQLLSVLTYLHTYYRQPIVHRDIKPTNIKITTHGELKLLDFGLATAEIFTNMRSAMHSVHGYTFTYISPEQINQEGTDPRSDLYSLGATLYHLLTGHMPIDGDGKTADALARILAIAKRKPDPIIAPKLLNPAIPEHVNQAIMRSLELDADERFASAEEFRRILAQPYIPVNDAQTTTWPTTICSRTITYLTKSSVERVCNVYLKDGQTILSFDSPLLTGHKYALCIQIGKYQDISLLDEISEAFPPLRPTGTVHKLFVTVSNSSTNTIFQFDMSCQVLLLPQRGESNTLEFPFIVQAMVKQSPVIIHIYYDWNIIQVIELALTTLLTKPRKGYRTVYRYYSKVIRLIERALTKFLTKPHKRWRSTYNHHAAIRYTRTQGFTDLAMLSPQNLTITLYRHNDTYQLTIAWPDVDTEELACIHIDFPIQSAELNMVIGLARKTLYEATWYPSYRTQVDGYLRDQRNSLYALAVAGNRLYTTLFAPERALPQAHQALMLFREWIATLMATSVARLPKLQIIHRDVAIGIPWGLLYPDPVNDPSMIDAAKFWGCAFQLEVLTPTLAFHLQKRQHPRSAITIQSGVHTFRLAQETAIVDLTAQHRDALTQLANSHAVTIEFYERANRELLRRMTQNTDLLYMFCHGHTARPEGDLMDWRKIFHEHLDQLSPEVQTRYKDLLNTSEQHPHSDPNQADSWLKWTDSLIPLRILKQWLDGLIVQHQPLVILNMCESAQVLPSFDHGFIPFFSQVGARGIVGTECPIVAPFAAAFGEQLIEALLQGKRIGEILPSLRRKFIEEHRNPLGLAYTYYGDAGLQIARKPDSAKETT